MPDRPRTLDYFAPADFERIDPRPDSLFYESPRYVVHIDDGAIAAVGTLIERLAPPHPVVLDLMSSYRSHLPPAIEPREVVGVGLNAEEMAANPQLTRWLVHDLNVEPAPPLPARSPAPTGSYGGSYCGLMAGIAASMLKTTGLGDSAQARMIRTYRPPAPVPTVINGRLADYGSVSAAADRERISGRRAAKYLVEVHKKLSLMFAPIPFALIAVVMALRYPRGGMGLVMGGGMFVYAIFYVGLNAGESLADRGYLQPALAMWSPNIVLGILAIFGLIGVSREYGSARGGR